MGTLPTPIEEGPLVFTLKNLLCVQTRRPGKYTDTRKIVQSVAALVAEASLHNTSTSYVV